MRSCLLFGGLAFMLAVADGFVEVTEASWLLFDRWRWSSVDGDRRMKLEFLLGLHLTIQ